MRLIDLRWNSGNDIQHRRWSQGFYVGNDYGRVIERAEPKHNQTKYAFRIVRGKSRAVMLDICDGELELACWLAGALEKNSPQT